MRWFIPDDARRPRALRRYFEVVLPRLYRPAGEILMTDDPVGGAAWVAPGRWPFTAREQLPVAPTLLRVFGPRPLRTLRGLRTIEHGHPSAPHWYLDYIGVERGGQGRGAGSALLRPMLDRLDDEGAPAYLHAGSPDSRRLYERHGFEVTEEFRLPFDGPPLWRMWREPR